jgi:protein ImuB
MARFAAIALVNLRVELATVASEAGVLGIVIAWPGGAVTSETSIRGNTRLDEVSLEAHALGVRPGQTIAAARARAAHLRVRVVQLESVSKTLAGLAEMAFAFGATTAFEAGGFAGDIVWVDITGCGHLHASESDSDGERTLLARLADRVLGMGHVCRVAVADGPHVAAAVARFASCPSRTSIVAPPIIVPPGGNARALSELPLAALALQRGRNEKTFAWLSSIGIRRIADMQKLPRKSLGLRLGADSARVLSLLEGDDRAPLSAYAPPEIPAEEALLEHPIESAEALLFVVKRLAGRLAARLAGRCAKVSRLELVLRWRRPSMTGKSKSDEEVSTILLAAPLARESDLVSVLKTKIEAQDRRGPFVAPIEGVVLRAVELVAGNATELDLLTPESKADRALPKLASELSADLGHEAVGMLALANTWVMEDRSRLVPFGVKRAKLPISAFLSGGTEPSRLLPKPLAVRRSALLHSRLVARFEKVQWWRCAFSSRKSGQRDRVEQYASWILDIPRPGARTMAWVETGPDGAAEVRGFLD